MCGGFDLCFRLLFFVSNFTENLVLAGFAKNTPVLINFGISGYLDVLATATALEVLVSPPQAISETTRVRVSAKNINFFNTIYTPF